METNHRATYRGRFAPTPSGPLHLGSLLTALASCLEARAAGGQWLLRVDDLDRARCPPGTDAVILRQLEQHGLCWDGAVRYQAQHLDEYRDALERLARTPQLYACSCTRATLRASSLDGPDGPVYPGTCRTARRPSAHHALRLAVDDRESCFDDGWQGRQCRQLRKEVGDFVVRRTDGVPAYQLACAVDEHAQGITHVVRGADLLGSTFCQLCVQQRLGHAPPRYRHLPILADGRGRKLSKQNRADPVEGDRASDNLRLCLRLLNQVDIGVDSPERMLATATAHWDPQRVPRTAQIRDHPL